MSWLDPGVYDALRCRALNASGIGAAPFNRLSTLPRVDLFRIRTRGSVDTKTVNLLDLLGNGRVHRDLEYPEKLPIYRESRYSLTSQIPSVAPDEWTLLHHDNPQQQLSNSPAALFTCGARTTRLI